MQVTFCPTCGGFGQPKCQVKTWAMVVWSPRGQNGQRGQELNIFVPTTTVWASGVDSNFELDKIGEENVWHTMYNERDKAWEEGTGRGSGDSGYVLAVHGFS